jgi:hypothetical protein
MFQIPAIYLWSAGSALFALTGMLIASKIVKPIDLDIHQPCLDATLNIVGTLVSILLGLLVAASLNTYQTLAEDVDAEAASVAGICRLSFGLSVETREQLLRLAFNYCEQVIDDEWPAMSEGKTSIKVLDTYANLLKAIVTMNPENNRETNIQSALITSVQTLGDDRRKRTLWLKNNWTKNLMPVLIMCSLIVITFAYLYVKQGAALLHSFLICFVATALGANLGLVHLLNNPFQGDWKIQPKAFELNLQLIRKFSDIR